MIAVLLKVGGSAILICTSAYKTQHTQRLHGPSMFAVKAKIYGVLYKQSSSMIKTIAFDETSSYWSAHKNSYFLGFSLVSTR